LFVLRLFVSCFQPDHKRHVLAKAIVGSFPEPLLDASERSETAFPR
jgi:hypothetical protein